MHYSQEIDALKRRIDGFRMKYHERKAVRDQLLERKAGLEEELEGKGESLDTIEAVRVLLQKVSEYAREQSRVRIQSFVTDCLRFIFGPDVEFSIEIKEVRGKPEAEFYVLSHRDGAVVRTRPQEARGGGILDIISIALRIAMLQCTNINLDGPIILDEPAKHVSEDYIMQVGEFLKQYSEVSGRQIIMVTHNRHLSEIADRWLRIEMREGISRIANDS